MDSSLWVAKTGLDAQQRRMTVVANNLANVNTTGFKKDRAVFEGFTLSDHSPTWRTSGPRCEFTDGFSIRYGYSCSGDRKDSQPR